MHARSGMPKSHYVGYQAVSAVVFVAQRLLNFRYEFLALQ
jgi:hypothetical protein